MISCLMPTYNRYSSRARILVQEAVESFLRQDYDDKELLILNDTPGQQLVCNLPGVRVFNFENRFEYLSDKIQYMIDQAHGDFFCRWDDDDISLAHRLSYSMAKLRASNRIEWSANNYWFSSGGKVVEKTGPVNVHVMAIWHRSLLELFPEGKYPSRSCGTEDVQVNQALKKKKLLNPEHIPQDDMYYIYRWGVSACHLSSQGDQAAHYKKIGNQKIITGEFEIRPKWEHAYMSLRKGT